MNRNSVIIIAVCAIAMAFASCGNKEKDTSTWSSDEATQTVESGDTTLSRPYSDLKMFELKGPVKECVRETYYDIRLRDNEPVIDSGVKPRVTNLYFDKTGTYVLSENELVKRDEKGRITYWRDNRPNSKGTHPGLLRDTLSYKHVNDNLLETSGMGEFAIAVYDNEGRIVGQYSRPDVNGTEMSAFNVYRRNDENGNWTERLTIWASSSKGGRPHVSYSLERRQITYY